MIDREKYQSILILYKQAFKEKIWPGEKFKWAAVKHFQDHWDIHADDFAKMFERATGKTYNLLASSHFYPRATIIRFAQDYPEDTRAMFIDLLDEEKDVVDRILAFGLEADHLKERYGETNMRQHDQNTNAISTYLWLANPEKYYIYKYSEVKKVVHHLKSPFAPVAGRNEANLRGFFPLYDEIRGYLASDAELTQFLNEVLDEECYPDPNRTILTMDFGFYISRVYDQEERKKRKFDLGGYDPNITAETWLELLDDRNVFTEKDLQIMKRLLDYGGEATCSQLADRYGENKSFYNSGSVALARRVIRKTGAPVSLREGDKARWWSVLYEGRYADSEEAGVFVWRVRDELLDALNKYDLNDIALFAEKSGREQDVRYWWLVANPKIWSFSQLDVGDIESFSLYNERGNPRQVFENFLAVRVGDQVIGYESSPTKQVVALAEIVESSDGENIYIEKKEQLIEGLAYSLFEKVKELADVEFLKGIPGTLFKLTGDEYAMIMAMIRESNPLLTSSGHPYSVEDFLCEVYMSPEDYKSLVSLLRNKKNLILQGAPGVGKTFTAKRLAYSMMGEKNKDRVEQIQFHQNYSYEDFVMGYKPKDSNFELQYGIFYRFCRKAANDPGREYFLIIDEINRGNLSKIFGELLMLIENDYRGTRVTFAYDKKPFSVPENLYIIGMMNTADRGLALIDYALRRRFSFFDIAPAFNSEGFLRYQKSFEDDTLDVLIEKIKELNKEIEKDDALGEGFRIGHSYFCNREGQEPIEWLKEVLRYDIFPTLSEYWFDDKDKVRLWENRLSEAVSD